MQAQVQKVRMLPYRPKEPDQGLYPSRILMWLGCSYLLRVLFPTR